MWDTSLESKIFLQWLMASSDLTNYTNKPLFSSHAINVSQFHTGIFKNSFLLH